MLHKPVTTENTSNSQAKFGTIDELITLFT